MTQSRTKLTNDVMIFFLNIYDFTPGLYQFWCMSITIPKQVSRIIVLFLYNIWSYTCDGIGATKVQNVAKLFLYKYKYSSLKPT